MMELKVQENPNLSGKKTGQRDSRASGGGQRQSWRRGVLPLLYYTNSKPTPELSILRTDPKQHNEAFEK